MVHGIWLNLILCFFNLIPIPPLDGSHLLYHALPPKAGSWYRGLQRFGYLPLFALMFLFRPVVGVLLTPGVRDDATSSTGSSPRTRWWLRGGTLLAMTTPEAPTTALGAGPGFVVQLDAFSGPLDLLLHLLREEQLEIADIPIARIADQFLQAIHELGLNQAADYLDMASRLVRLKAQMLLPRRSEEDGWEDPRAELVRRLLEYQQIREIAVWMGRAAERRAEQFARGYLPPPPELPPPPLTLDLLELLQAVERVIAGIPHAGAAPRRRAAARRRGRHPADRGRCSTSGSSSAGSRRSGPRPTIVDVLSTLLALLELAKRGAVRLAQPAPFSPMVIARDTARPAA